MGRSIFGDAAEAIGDAGAWAGNAAADAGRWTGVAVDTAWDATASAARRPTSDRLLVGRPPGPTASG